MSKTADVTVRQCESDEWKFLIKYIEEQKWDYTMYDYRSYMRLDPNFLLVAIDNSTGEPIGFAGLGLSSSDLYYFSNFIVRNDRRGQGIGRKLWKAMLVKTGDTCIALDGVSAMVDWYKRNGFTFQSFKLNMYTMQLNEEMKMNVDGKYMVKIMSDEDWPRLMNYDRKVYLNFDRKKVLRAWFTDEAVKVYIAWNEGTIAGYGSIHKQSETTYALRNVFADNEHVLEEMLSVMFECLPSNTTIRYWILDDKHVPKCLKTSCNLSKSCTRLYTKGLIDVNTDRMWIGTTETV